MRTEQGALRLSLVAILCFAGLGITFGLVSGSYAIIFDGVFSLVDAAISIISIAVASLIARSTATSGVGRGISERTARRFTLGFWHFEPMVLALSSLVMMCVAAYGMVQAVLALLTGGRDVQFGPAVVYAAIVFTLSCGVGFSEHRANRRIGSALVALDIKGWVMATGVTAALLVAFIVGLAIRGTELEWLMPYVDPAVLALITLVLLPLPVPDLRRALAEIALIAPAGLLDEAETVVGDVVAQHGFTGGKVAANQQGRSRQLEVAFLVPPEKGVRPLEEWDVIRDDVRRRLIGEDLHSWVTVSFTTRGAAAVAVDQCS